MTDLHAGMILHVTSAASPQFVKPIHFRLIRVRTDLITYDHWTWLDGYQLDDNGDATAQRSIFVQPAALIVQKPPPSRPATPSRPSPPHAPKTRRHPGEG